jgi:pimeloyl-ACP methyl ester carboxylesterase
MKTGRCHAIGVAWSIMRITINGVRLFFDVEGPLLGINGPVMRERPIMILLHGGPGLDHSHYRPGFSQLAEIAQVIYLDYRGHGRSERGAPGSWNTVQWGDDLKAFCDALGIERPIVLGTSLGGFVAMSYAARYPDHPGRLILANTQARGDKERTLAMFERLGGMAARNAAWRLFSEGSAEALTEYSRLCSPLYHRRPQCDKHTYARALYRSDVIEHFFRTPGGEATTLDLLPQVARIVCPTLVLCGEEDPITPLESGRELAARLGADVVRFEQYPETGHTVFDDEPRSYEAVRAFVMEDRRNIS